MNEKIKSLAEQAITEELSLDEFIEALKKEPHDFYAFRVSELQKFAELMHDECIDAVPVDLDPGTYFRVLTAIKEHFGVD
jgi:hypothetical protein